MKGLTFLALMLPAICFGQPSPTETDGFYPTPFEYSVVDSANGTKDELFSRAYSFLVKSFKSPNNVIQMQDRFLGRLVAKGLMTTNTQVDGWGNFVGEDYVDFTITIDVKDGKARCLIADFVHRNGYGAAYKEFGSLQPNPERQMHKRVKGRYYKVKTEVDAQSKELLSSFSTEIKKSNNW